MEDQPAALDMDTQASQSWLDTSVPWFQYKRTQEGAMLPSLPTPQRRRTDAYTAATYSQSFHPTLLFDKS